MSTVAGPPGYDSQKCGLDSENKRAIKDPERLRNRAVVPTLFWFMASLVYYDFFHGAQSQNTPINWVYVDEVRYIMWHPYELAVATRGKHWHRDSIAILGVNKHWLKAFVEWWKCVPLRMDWCDVHFSLEGWKQSTPTWNLRILNATW